MALLGERADAHARDGQAGLGIEHRGVPRIFLADRALGVVQERPRASRKRTPAITCASRSVPSSRRQWRSAPLASLKTIASVVSRDRQPFVLSVRSRTVAKVLSIGFVVLTCFQCSAGTAQRAGSASRSLAKQATALSYLGPYL